MANEFVTLNPYDDQLEKLRQRQKMADLLQQQALQPLESQVAPGGYAVRTSPVLGLAKMLQAYMGGREQNRINTELSNIRDQAMQEQRNQEAETASTAAGMTGRMFGEKPPQYDKNGVLVTPRTPEPVVTEPSQPSDQLGEITPTAKYQYDPAAAMQMAMTPAGARAMQGNPMLASMLAQMAKPKTLEIGAIDPSKFTPESIRAAQSSGDYAKLEPIATTKTVDLQRKTRTIYDKSGNEMYQDYNFNPVTGSEQLVGNPYRGKPNIPGAGASQQNAAEMRKEFTSVTGQYRSIADAWQKIQQSSSKPTAANDIALLYGYMRILDPSSTVREGEFATASQAGGVPTRILAQYNKLVNGERLSPEQRNEFASSAYDIVQSQKPLVEGLQKRYSDIATRSGLNPLDIVYNPFENVSPFTPPESQLPPGFTVNTRRK